MSDGPVIVATGGWYALAAVLEDRRIEFETWADIVQTEGGVACPFCGEPLSASPGTVASAAVSSYCRYAGDHKFRVPGDVIRPVEGAKMGRSG